MKKRLSEQHRARIGRGLALYHARRQKTARVVPSDLLRLRESGTVPPRLRAFLEAAAVEAAELFDSLGGRERLSAQRIALVEDVARLGLAMRASLARFVQAGDGDAAGRVSTLAAVRRANLVALGLDRHAEEVPDLRAYLEQRAQAAQAPPGEANGGRPHNPIGDAGQGVPADAREAENAEGRR